MDGVMLSYLSQPSGAVPLPVGLQVATSIRCLVNQTQQLYSLWQTAKGEDVYTHTWVREMMAHHSRTTVDLLVVATLIMQYVEQV